MKNKILVSTILLMLFLFPFSVLGATIYERTPSGYTIENPVSFEVGFDTWGEVCSKPESVKWAIQVFGVVGYELIWESDNQASTTKSVIFETNLSFLEYQAVVFDCRDINDITTYDSHPLESDPFGDPIFEVIAPPVIPPITAGFEDYTMASTTAYIGDLWNSAGVYIYLFIGIPLGFWIIKRVIDEAKIRKVKGRKSD